MVAIPAVNFAKSTNPSQSNRNDPGAIGGRVRSLTDTVVLAGAAINDTVPLGKILSPGAIIHGIEVTNVALGALVTINVGDSDDPNRYMSLIDGNTPSTKRDLILAGIHYVVGTNTGDGTIQLEIQGAAATGQVNVTIYYSED